MISWLFESSGGLVVLTAFGAALVATIAWAAVWLAVVAAALALRVAVTRLPRVRTRHVRARPAREASR